MNCLHDNDRVCDFVSIPRHVGIARNEGAELTQVRLNISDSWQRNWDQLIGQSQQVKQSVVVSVGAIREYYPVWD